MRIDTEIQDVIVEIEDREYALAPRTADVCDKLRAAELELVGKPAYQLWRRELEIILGKSAVRELFPNGGKENIDRMQMIYYGVSKAFNRVNDRLEEERVDDRAERVDRLFAAANEFLRNMKAVNGGNGIREIRRGE